MARGQEPKVVRCQRWSDCLVAVTFLTTENMGFPKLTISQLVHTTSTQSTWLV